jgi:cytochrome c peroxidase
VAATFANGFVANVLARPARIALALACGWLAPIAAWPDGGTANAATGDAANVEHHHAPPAALAPGYSRLAFAPPTPGTYELPPLRRAADGDVLDEAGRAHRLHDYFGDRVVVLAFIYTTCSDVNGCPLAAYVLKQVQDRALTDPALRDRLRLVSVSFDPRHDTPSVMAAYGERLRAPRFDWVFLTSASDAAIQPVLDAYDQWIVRDASGALSHTLRVMLIDRQMRVRNIYSVSFLHADLVLSDVRTLLLEEPPTSADPRPPA